MAQQNEDDLLLQWGINYRKAVKEMTESNELGFAKRTEQEISAKAAEIATEKNRQEVALEPLKPEPVLEKEKTIDQELQEAREKQDAHDILHEHYNQQELEKLTNENNDLKDGLGELRADPTADPLEIEKLEETIEWTSSKIEEQARLKANEQIREDMNQDEKSLSDLVKEKIDPKVIEKIREEARERQERERQLEAERRRDNNPFL